MARRKKVELYEKKKTGRPRKFKTAGDLWHAAVDYFKWCADNPHTEEVLVTNRGNYKRVKLNKTRAMTEIGFCIHSNMTQRTYDNYKHHPDYAETCRIIDGIMYEQKFTGAAAGIFGHQIIARDLGLKDQQELTGADGGPVQTVNLSREEYIKIRKEMMEADDC